MEMVAKSTVNYNVGFYSAIVLAGLTLLAFGFAMIAVPPSGPYCPGNCMTYPYTDILKYFPRDYIWMYITVFQLCAFLIFMIANNFAAPEEKKIFSFSAVAFALMATTVLLGNYFLQFSVIPISLMQGQKEGMALLTQYNGHGIFIVLEELGFILMSISFAFLALVFTQRTRLEMALRGLLVLPLGVSLLAFLGYTFKYGLDRDYRFEVATITVNWLVTPAVGILLGVWFRQKLSALRAKETV